MNNQKIAVFDSGVGGLTVLKELQKHLPNESFIYIGDNLHSPYGEKTTEQLLEYTTDIIDYFTKQNVKMVVLACNTTSCTVLDTLKKRYPALPMIGVVDATVEMVKLDQPKQVAVMATKATIQSGAYQKQIGIHQSVGVACVNLVPLIEGNAKKETIQKEVAMYMAEAMKKCDSIILGCTHYPIIASYIQELYPKAKLYSSSIAVVKQVQTFLEVNNLEAKIKQSKDFIYTTGQLEAFIQSSSSFYDFEGYEVKKLELKVA